MHAVPELFCSGSKRIDFRSYYSFTEFIVSTSLRWPTERVVGRYGNKS